MPKKKDDSPATINRYKLAILHWRDGREYWIKGFEFYDYLERSTSRGMMKLKLKPLRENHKYIVEAEQKGKPIQIHDRRIAKVVSGKHYFTFQEIFGQGGKTAVIFTDAEKAVQEDLTLGVAVPEEE